MGVNGGAVKGGSPVYVSGSQLGCSRSPVPLECRIMTYPRSASLPHTGIATFCKAPYIEDLTGLEAEIAVFGVPLDAAVGMRPGCRQGPRAIRDASTRFGFLGRPAGDGGYFDINKPGRRLEGVRIADCGDADVLYYDQERTFDNVTRLTREVLEAGALPLVLGGDHSISYPVVRGFTGAEVLESRPLTIVLIDAHLDYRDASLGLRYTNNSPFRRIHELDCIARIITVGVRGIKSTDREHREALEHGHLVFSNYDVFERGVEPLVAALPEDLGPYYVSLDIDGLDPSIAPGTESPEAEGLTYTQVKRFLQLVAERGRLVGLDLVEVNPYLDPAELTAHMAAQLLIETAATGF